MMVQRRYADYYVFQDLYTALDGGRIDEVKKLFRKYIKRYPSDRELSVLGSMASAYLGSNVAMEDEIKRRLRRLTVLRRLTHLEGHGKLFPYRMNLR